MFPDNLYISDPTDGRLYVVENDVVSGSISINTNDTEINQGHAILVCQNMADVYTVNRNTDTITRIRNGQVVGDIKVGRMPYGICEDKSGRIYVTNHMDETVSVIENGQVIGHPISVPGGPKGIVADYFGNIWVSCYLTNTVVKIVNMIVVDTIPVAYNPDGITCSSINDIWVACSGSNVVVKISEGKKKLTLPTGKCPIAVVTDKKGNVFTANFEDDTVTMISTSDENQSTTIAVGDGPSAIGINSQGHIYVTSSLSQELVYKINPFITQVIDTIHVCKSQSAYGDFTGCAAYNVFFPNGIGDGYIAEGSVGNVIQTLSPRCKVVEIDEENNVKIKLDSDLMDLSKFSRLVLNGKEINELGEFVLTADEIGNNLQLVGYLDNDDDAPIIFKTISFGSVFTAYIGVTDNNYQNCVTLKEVTIDFDNRDLVTAFVEQNKQGHLILFVPTRNFSTFKDGFMVQGNHDIGNTWSETIPDASVPVADTVEEWNNIDTSDTSEGNRSHGGLEISNTDTLVVTSGSTILEADTDYVVSADPDVSNRKRITLNNFDKVVNNTVVITIKHAETDSVAGSTLLSNIYSNDLQWSNSKKNKYKILVNTYQTNNNEKWMFNFFNTLR